MWTGFSHKYLEPTCHRFWKKNHCLLKFSLFFLCKFTLRKWWSRMPARMSKNKWIGKEKILMTFKPYWFVHFIKMACLPLDQMTERFLRGFLSLSYTIMHIFQCKVQTNAPVANKKWLQREMPKRFSLSLTVAINNRCWWACLNFL